MKVLTEEQVPLVAGVGAQKLGLSAGDQALLDQALLAQLVPAAGVLRVPASMMSSIS